MPFAYPTLSFGIFVVMMGSPLLIHPKFSFSWAKLNLLSLLCGLNNVISGGGYGPVAKTGFWFQETSYVLLLESRSFSVIFINKTAFVIYFFARAFTSMELPVFLTVGVLIGSQIGPMITTRMIST